MSPGHLLMPGMPERRSHEYVRIGVTTLFAALNTVTGEVIGSLYRRHRPVEFKKFLTKLDSEVPAGLDLHLVCVTALANSSQMCSRDAIAGLERNCLPRREPSEGRQQGDGCAERHDLEGLQLDRRRAKAT
jgi:hypothetical protein